MKKKYLMNGLAVMALGLVAASCSTDDLSQTDYVANAERALGVAIDTYHDWKTTQDVTANITVNWGSGKSYTIYVFDKSPFDNDDAVYFSKTEVTDGTVSSLNLAIPLYLTELYVSVFDSNEHSISKRVAVTGNTAVAVFGTPMSSSYVFTRSLDNPEVLEIDQPYDETWVANYLTTAKEPNSQNVNDNYNDSRDAIASTWVKTGEKWIDGTEGHWVIDVPAVETKPSVGQYQPGTIPNTLRYGGTGYWENGSYIEISQTDINWYNENYKPLFDFNFNGFDWNSYDDLTRYVTLVLDVYNKCQSTNRGNWITLSGTWALGSKTEEVKHWEEGTEGHLEEEGYWTQAQEAYIDPTFVLNFKITGTWDGGIGVAATEGLTDGVANNNERTVVVTGTWNITEDQRIGSKGRIIIANGGIVNVAEGKTLNMVNQARLVVLPGGKLTGDGSVEVNNGNAEGEENYNGGTIDVATFNNNFGKFYNYGKFLVNQYDAGATESNFYNHSLVSIDHTGNTPNARIFNACQFYVKKDARLRNYEGVSGSALIVDGQLMTFGSADGTSIPSFVCLAAGALVKCGSLYNGSSWIGPTQGGYAALEIVNQIDYLTWVQDSPQTAGYFANNIYVKCGDWDNDPAGQGYHQDDATDVYNYKVSRAKYKFFEVAANCTGNGNVKKVDDGNEYYIDADNDFVLGSKGCTPGFKMTNPGDDEEEEEEEIHNNAPQNTNPVVYTFAFEDTFMGDYDMNDVVLQAWEDPEDNTNAYVKLMATGASMDLYVCYTFGGSEEFVFRETEVHSLLGGTRGKFINTGSGSSEKFQTGTPFTTKIRKLANTSVADLDLWIKAGNNKIHVGSKNPTWQLGDAPFGIVVVGEWAWPKEWTCIKDAYPRFSDFAKDKAEAQDWYKDTPAENSTYYVTEQQTQQQ